ERRSHPPVAGDLPEPVVFLRAHDERDLQDVVRALREELSSPPVSGLAHLHLAAQFVKLENQMSIGYGRLLGHENSSGDSVIGKLRTWQFKNAAPQTMLNHHLQNYSITQSLSLTHWSQPLPAAEPAARSRTPY